MVDIKQLGVVSFSQIVQGGILLNTKYLSCLLTLCLVFLTGCGSKQAGSPAEQPEAPVEEEVAVLPDALPLDLTFASGAGAWCTGLTLERDGSFTGVYHDSGMGD